MATPLARAFHAMSTDPAGDVVLFGGSNMAAIPTLFSDTWTYNGAAWTLETPIASPPARWKHAMALNQADSLVYLHGGLDAGGATLDDTWTWDGSAWTQLSPATTPAIAAGGLSYDPLTGNLLLVGDVSGVLTLYAWDGSDWQQLAP